MQKILIYFITLVVFASCNKKNDSNNSTPGQNSKNNSWCKITKATTNFGGTATTLTDSWNGNKRTEKDASGTITSIVIYNDNGKELSNTNYDAFGSILFSYTYEYTDCANLCKKSKYSDNTNNPSIVHTFSWNGNIAIEKDASGKTISSTTYNDYGKELTIIVYQPNGTITSTTNYEYTDCANWCKITKTTINTSVQSTCIWTGNVQKTYDSSNQLLSTQTYNDYGEVLSGTSYNPDGSEALTFTNEYTDCKN